MEVETEAETETETEAEAGARLLDRIFGWVEIGFDMCFSLWVCSTNFTYGGLELINQSINLDSSTHEYYGFRYI